MDLLALVEGKINEYAQTIISGNDKADDFAMGELGFYISLRRVLKGHSNMQDLGLMDAINDVLQAKGLIEKGKTFYK